VALARRVSGSEKPIWYHINRRPPLAEVRIVPDRLQDRASRHSDSLYVDSLVSKRHLEVVSLAPAYAKAAVQDIDAAALPATECSSSIGGT